MNRLILNWRPDGGGQRADVGHIYVAAYEVDDPLTSASVVVEAFAPTTGEAMDKAEATLLKTYEVLREHYDPVPTLKWRIAADGGRVAMLGLWLVEAKTIGWSLVSRLEDGKPRIVATGSDSAKTIEANQRHAELALRAHGVKFSSNID